MHVYIYGTLQTRSPFRVPYKRRTGESKKVNHLPVFKGCILLLHSDILRVFLVLNGTVEISSNHCKCHSVVHSNKKY